MIVKNFVLIFFISFFLFVNCQNNTTEDNSTQAMDPMTFIQTYQGVCVPIPLGIDILSQFQPNCTSLFIPSQNDTQFHCCEIEFQEKKNKSAPVRHGCMAVLKNYVDNDRYEDMIDYIKRGKQDIESMKKSLQVLKDNKILAIFPEGTRNGIQKNGIQTGCGCDM